MRTAPLILVLAFAVAAWACVPGLSSSKITETSVVVKDSFSAIIIQSALTQTHRHVTYDGSYRVIPYPNGDVPDSLGVCTDVIIRAYRKAGYDLQKLIHEDMLQAFSVYKKRRFSDKIDANIDHRRTPNMETFFNRHGHKLQVTKSATDYKPGDIVFWDVSAGHVGIVVNQKSASDSARFLIVHNIGSGPRLQDFLFSAEITGHYRYTPWIKK